MKQTIDAEGLKAAENRILQERLTGNISPGSEALKRAASEGRLLYEEIPGGLALFEKRSNVIVLRFALGRELITYILTDGLELPVVCETAYRSGDRQLRSTTAFLKHQGFELGARRMRLSVKPEKLKGNASSAGKPADGIVISDAVPEDLPDLMDLIKQSFDPLTGCIPEEMNCLKT